MNFVIRQACTGTLLRSGRKTFELLKHSLEQNTNSLLQALFRESTLTSIKEHTELLPAALRVT